MLFKAFLDVYYNGEYMQAPLHVDAQGKFYADFCMDDAPPGFEDHFHESMCMRRFMENRAFAEFGEPNTDGLIGDPVATLRRVLCIEDRNICGWLTLQALSQCMSRFRVYIQPYGPLQHSLLGEFVRNPQRLALKFRCIEKTDEDDEVRVANIPGIDLVLT